MIACDQLLRGCRIWILAVDEICVSIGMVFILLSTGFKQDAVSGRDDLKIRHSRLCATQAGVIPFHLRRFEQFDLPSGNGESL